MRGLPRLSYRGSSRDPRRGAHGARSRSRRDEPCRDEDLDEVGEPVQVTAGALGDLAQAVMRGVDVDVQPLGGTAGVEIGGDVFAQRGDERPALHYVVVDELLDLTRDQSARGGITGQRE